MLFRLTICSCLMASLAGTASAGSRKTGNPVAAAAVRHRMFRTLAAAVTGNLVTVTPSTVSFNSPDPDTTPVNGNSSTTVSWSTNGNNTGSWTLTVQSAASSFTGCSTVPLSAVKFSCTALTHSGSGTPNGSCQSGSFTLSTSPQTIASGARQGSPANFIATVAFTFTDAWNYPAYPSCQLNLTYTVTAN